MCVFGQPGAHVYRVTDVQCCGTAAPVVVQGGSILGGSAAVAVAVACHAPHHFFLLTNSDAASMVAPVNMMPYRQSFSFPGDTSAAHNAATRGHAARQHPVDTDNKYTRMQRCRDVPSSFPPAPLAFFTGNFNKLEPAASSNEFNPWHSDDNTARHCDIVDTQPGQGHHTVPQQPTTTHWCGQCHNNPQGTGVGSATTAHNHALVRAVPQRPTTTHLCGQCHNGPQQRTCVDRCPMPAVTSWKYLLRTSSKCATMLGHLSNSTWFSSGSSLTAATCPNRSASTYDGLHSQDIQRNHMTLCSDNVEETSSCDESRRTA